MSDKPIQIAMGDNPEEVGHCFAITFLIEQKGRKLKGRVLRRQEFQTGIDAKTTCQALELELSKQYQGQVGTFYVDEPLPDYEIETRLREIARSLE